MDTKLCRKCGDTKPTTEFDFKDKAKGKLTAHCKTCNRKRSKQHFLDNRQDYYDRRDKQKEEIKDWYREYKKALKCVRCEENHPACLDFHHVDPNEKTMLVPQCVSNGWSISAVRKEIAKCIVLCANCHRKEHFSES